MKHNHIIHSSLALVAGCVLTINSQANERRFTYVYEATTAPAKSVEYEQWVTWKARRGSGGKADQFDFRHELEFGITDRFQLGLYLSDWSVKRVGGKTETTWKDVAVEGIYNLSNPSTDFLGSALYGEVKLGDEIFAVEGKLLLQKNLGNWVIAYNAAVEAEWEGPGYDERVGEFQQTLGVSYQVSPKVLLGVEALHEIVWENWEEASDHVFYVGPNVSFRTGRMFATATVLFQASDLADEADVQTRLIVGWQF